MRNIMQKTRQKILEYLKQHGEATVDELSSTLDNLTAVTVRHHLDVLRSEGLVASPAVRHRDSPGRPKYVYGLTEKAEALFPKNFQSLTIHLLDELKSTLDPQQLDEIFEGLSRRMLQANGINIPEDATLEERMAQVVEYLNNHGYVANYEPHPEGFVLNNSNCPYSGVAETHGELCTLDVTYIGHLLGMDLKRISHRKDGGYYCSFLVTEAGFNRAHSA
jgi:predicted ArsR family transcriptional regulator